MTIKEKRYYSTISLVLLFIFLQLGFSIQSFAQIDNKSSAYDLFNSGDFKSATHLFQKLHDSIPNDPTINYYLGACNIETGNFSEETNKILLNAVSGNTPNKIYYYVGKYLEHNKMLDSALKYYTRFKNLGSEEEKAGLDIESLILKCSQPTIADTTFSNPHIKIYDESNTSINTIPPKKEKEEIDVNIPSTIDFQVNSEIYYIFLSHFNSDEAKKYFEDGANLQSLLKRNLQKTDSLRELYESASIELKQQLSQDILTLESESYKLNIQSSDLFSEARKIESTFWNEKSKEEIMVFQNQIDEDLQGIENSKKGLNKTVDSISSQNYATVFFDSKKTNELSKEQNDDKDIIFKIQVGAFSKGVPNYVQKQFRKLSLIRKIENYTDEAGIVVYTTGKLTNFDDAVLMQKQVRQEGIKDAFIVAYQNGERITIAKAKEVLDIE